MCGQERCGAGAAEDDGTESRAPGGARDALEVRLSAGLACCALLCPARIALGPSLRPVPGGDIPAVSARCVASGGDRVSGGIPGRGLPLPVGLHGECRPAVRLEASRIEENTLLGRESAEISVRFPFLTLFDLPAFRLIYSQRRFVPKAPVTDLPGL